MQDISDRLAELGLELPAPLELPSKNRTSFVLAGRMLYLSGHGAALLEDEWSFAAENSAQRYLRKRVIKRPVHWL